MIRKSQQRMEEMTLSFMTKPLAWCLVWRHWWRNYSKTLTEAQKFVHDQFESCNGKIHVKGIRKKWSLQSKRERQALLLLLHKGWSFDDKLQWAKRGLGIRSKRIGIEKSEHGRKHGLEQWKIIFSHYRCDQASDTWILDFGSTYHMCMDRDWFDAYKSEGV